MQIGPFAATPLGAIINSYQDRFLLTYQFFFFLGAFAALYLSQARAFLLRYSWLVVSFFLLILGVFWGHYFQQNLIYHENNNYTLSVLQPAILFYSISIITLFSWLAGLWARRTDKAGHPKGYRFWQTLSNASFGVYLVHALFLNRVVITHIAPLMPSAWPAALSVFLVWALTVSMSVIVSLLFLRIPIISRLVGRVHPGERKLISYVWHTR